MNTVTVTELRRRGMAAIEEGLQHGPLHILKRKRPVAVVLSEEEYRRLAGRSPDAPAAMSAVQWLLASTPVAGRSKAAIDAGLVAERAACGGD